MTKVRLLRAFPFPRGEVLGMSPALALELARLGIAELIQSYETATVAPEETRDEPDAEEPGIIRRRGRRKR